MRAQLTVADVMKIVPHRYPFAMIDRVVALDAGRRIVAVKNVSRGDPLGSNADGALALPAEMLIEAVGQAAMVLILSACAADRDIVPLFVGCESTCYTDVHAGCQVVLEAGIEKLVSKAAIICGSATVRGRRVADMRLTAGLLETALHCEPTPVPVDTVAATGSFDDGVPECDIALKKANQRFPYPLLDEVWIDSEGHGRKYVSRGETYFVGHFPGEPILPGVLIIGALRAVAGVLLDPTSAWHPRWDARFRFVHPVQPGDILNLTVKRLERSAGSHWFQGNAAVGNRVVAKGTFSL
jgi:3-hydroxyacyl-[acyl-carrier-protein] dehydratase